jgi:hypothetical protein
MHFDRLCSIISGMRYNAPDETSNGSCDASRSSAYCLLARLIEVAPRAWLLKGGLALDLRLDGRARSTQDVDLAWFGDASTADETLTAVQQLNLSDYFALHVERTSLLDNADVDGAIRFRVECALAHRHLAAFHLDVGFGRLVVGQPEALPGPTILSFSGIDRITVPVLPLPQHIAEKVHAYSRQYGPDGRPSTRVKDLIDLVLIQANTSLIALERFERRWMQFSGCGALK